MAGGFITLVVTGGLFNDDPAPIPSVSPSVSPSPSVTSAEPSVDSNGRALPGEVTVDPSLPDALPLPDGIWDEVEPGWVLVDYMPVVVGPSEFLGLGEGYTRRVLEHTQHVVYLISPDGTRYQVAELNPYSWFAITSWTAGETVAYVTLCDSPYLCKYQTGTQIRLLDLETGTLSPAHVPWDEGDEVEFKSTLPDGTRLWGTHENVVAFLETGSTRIPHWKKLDGWSGDEHAASPDGVYLALGRRDYGSEPPGYLSEILVVRLADQTTSVTPSLGGDWVCTPWEWADPTHLKMRCKSGGEGIWTDYTYDATTGDSLAGESGIIEYVDDYDESRRVDPVVGHERQLDYGLYAGHYYDGPTWSDGLATWSTDDALTLGIDDHGTLSSIVLRDQSGEPFPDFWLEAPTGTSLTIGANNYEFADLWTILVYDVDTGSQTILIGPPLAGPTVEWAAAFDPQAYYSEGYYIFDDATFALAVLSWVVAN